MPRAHLDAYVLRDMLKRALKHGARPEHLAEHVPELIDYIAPTADYPGYTLTERGLRVEDVLTEACHDIGGDLGNAALIYLGLKAGTDIPLELRRAHAAHAWGIQPDTLRKDAWQGHLLLDIAFRICKILRSERQSTARIA